MVSKVEVSEDVMNLFNKVVPPELKEAIREARLFEKYKHSKWTHNWKKRNPEKVREQRKRYNQKHKEQLAEYKKKWCKAHPEKVREYQRRYYEKKKISNVK